MRYIFKNSKFNGDISNWDLNRSVDTNRMFG